MEKKKVNKAGDKRGIDSNPEKTSGYKMAMEAKGKSLKDKPTPKTPEEAKKQFPWMGRYNDTLPEKLVEHLSKGYSFESFGAEAGCGSSTLYRWVEDHPEFKEAKQYGEARGLRLFESMSVATTTGNEIKNIKGETQFNPKLSNTNMLQFLMRTRFHKVYGDKKEIDHRSSDGSMTPSITFEEVLPDDED